ncbi:DUF58 domain-containing protein [Natrinema sp. CBA1119]|uniref:DUF58 domain-containing protein n=1 Tax=Natrinema sp. CBA1119 TaxID=1608465 RepID=UPI000BF5E51C|nr:DUF58 domain-containing protein [Natrinema sp. CBA1119]PGF16331.1 DUF58 domain-containing protein [Natrinema sp. CBA1119]
MTDAIRQARWHGALVVTLVTALLAVVLGLPSLLFLGVVSLGFALVGEVSSVPTLGGGEGEADADADATGDAPDETDAEGGSAGSHTGLRLERAIEDARVRPGRSVTVTLSVTNESDRVASDVRVVDHPPADVPVTTGSPAFATAVRPGETVTHEYELTPPRGEYEFGTATVRCRSLSATAVTTDEFEPAGETGFTCETLLDSFPFQDRTIQYVGQTPTDDGGSGVEFFSTREYRRGDPMNRIDWHRFARTGDLATVEYREERAVTIVFVIDDRASVHRDAPGGGPDSYDLTLYAASRGVVASLEDGNRTGLVTLSGDTWIEPGGGSDTRSRVEDALEDAATQSPSGSASPPGSATDRPIADGGEGTTCSRSLSEQRSDGGEGTTCSRSLSEQRSDGGEGAADSRSDKSSLAVDLERRLPRRAQVVFCTPLSEAGAVDLVETLRTRGRAVTVVSPDLTTGVASTVTTGMQVAGLQRANRVDELRGLGTTVVDWQLEDPLSVDLARAFRAGSGRSGGRSP